jgi:outer membrane protein TolC
MLFMLGFLLVPVIEAKPLTFQDCVDLAVKSNPDLASAEEALRAQEFQVRGSFASFLPSASASLGVLRSHPVSIVDPRYTAALSVNYNLFSGLRDRSKALLAEANLALSRATLDSVRAQVSANLRKAMAQVLYAREYVGLTAMIRDRRSQNERLVRAQYESGRENQGSYLVSKSLLSQAEFDQTVARDQSELARQNLAHILGSDSRELVFEGDVPVSDPPPEDRASELLKLTPAHRAQTAKIQAAERTIEASRAGFLPSLDLGSTIGFSSATPPPDQNRSWNLGLTLTIPLFSGLSTYHDYQSSSALLRSTQSSATSVDFELLNQLRQALLGFRQSMGRLRVDLESLDAAVIRSAIARKRYNNGLIAFDQWDIIETDLINRQKAALTSKRERIIAESTYRQVQGLGEGS